MKFSVAFNSMRNNRLELAGPRLFFCCPMSAVANRQAIIETAEVAKQPKVVFTNTVAKLSQMLGVDLFKMSRICFYLLT